ncbi:unnamed protein product [Protopolystoma xenopodis]|uniref:Uncharacterized protein n=1 Tax=Protopolystoma xenopodis TaxID=117903 RepID=A0A3S5CVC3_9PLAT|nr:unnamed protein product [Protopolystoma xenopodis]
MSKLADDANYDAGETSENVPSRLSDAGSYDNYFGLGAFYLVALTTRPSCDNEVNPLLENNTVLGIAFFFRILWPTFQIACGTQSHAVTLQDRMHTCFAGFGCHRTHFLPRL